MEKTNYKRKPLQVIPPRMVRQVRRPVHFTSRWSFLVKLSWLTKLISKRRRILGTALACLVAVVLIIFLRTLFRSDEATPDLNVSTSSLRAQILQRTIIENNTPLVVDYTFNLQWSVNGQHQAIPTTYGELGDKKLIFSATDTAGDIRVQSPDDFQYTLGDFFLLWGGRFDENCLLNHCSSKKESITMTVNGQPNYQFGDYVLKPNDHIVILYSE